MAGKKLRSFLDFFGLDDDMDDEDYMDDVEEELEYDTPSNKVGSSARTSTPTKEDEPVVHKTFRSTKPKVVPMHSSSKLMEVNIVKPKSIEDSQEICNTLLNQRPVVVNLEGFDPDEAQRIMDFISGCIFAIDGKFHQISKYIFIFSPHNVDISGDSLYTGEGLGSAPTINREF